MRYVLGLGLMALVGCQSPSPQDQFMTHLNTLCGQSFEGQIISEDAVDDDWRAETLIMHVRDCKSTEVKIPLHVGENRSRTWVISQTDTGLRLKHDHRHDDGHPDAVTQYGGDTQEPGTATSQSFPVDQFSKDLFVKEGLDVSVVNVWSVHIEPGKSFTYELSRPNRDFRAKFDLTNPVETPPAAWGYKQHK